MGLPPELVESLTTAIPTGFEVWPVNMTIVDAFLTVATQWRTVPLADGRVHWLGLDYGSVRLGFQMAGMKVPPDIWRGVQTMERAAAAALNGS